MLNRLGEIRAKHSPALKKMQIAIKSFRQCGSERFIAEDSDIQEILTMLTKTKTLTEEHLDCLRDLGLVLTGL